MSDEYSDSFPEETYGQRLRDGFVQPEPRVYPPLQTTTLQGRLFDELNAHKRALRRLVDLLDRRTPTDDDFAGELRAAVQEAKELLK